MYYHRTTYSGSSSGSSSGVPTGPYYIYTTYTYIYYIIYIHFDISETLHKSILKYVHIYKKDIESHRNTQNNYSYYKTQ